MTGDITVSRSVLRAGEGPTWAALAGCYAVWLTATGWLSGLEGPAGRLWLLPAALATAFHSSLQHEALHGHPTRSARLNEALVFPAPGLLYPYRRFRDMHLRHHDDERLTDPYDDPESWYLAEADARRLSRPLRLALEANRTLAGRMIVGPWLGALGLLRADLPKMLRGDRRLIAAWGMHAGGVAATLAWVWGVCGISPLVYLLGVALPASALIYVRTFAEHRAAEAPLHRSALIEAGAFWRLLFLNNNYHALHHAEPTVAWHRLPARWRARREELRRLNGGYALPGYGAVFRRWLWRAREPLVHPFARRSP